MPLRSVTRVAVPLPLADARRVVPSVPLQRQFLTQWCWAACIAMVRSTPGVPFRQCEAAGLLIKDRDPCAGSGSGCTSGGPVLGDANPQCNEVAPLSQIAVMWSDVLEREVLQEGKLSKSRLNEKLDAGKTVQVMWSNDGSLHVVLVVGRDEDGQYLVHDPCEGARLLSYAQIVKVPGVREWDSTWVL